MIPSARLSVIFVTSSITSSGQFLYHLLRCVMIHLFSTRGKLLKIPWQPSPLPEFYYNDLPLRAALPVYALAIWCLTKRAFSVML